MTEVQYLPITLSSSAGFSVEHRYFVVVVLFCVVFLAASSSSSLASFAVVSLIHRGPPEASVQNRDPGVQLEAVQRGC